MQSNTLRVNFFYLKIIHILHPSYHPKIKGHIIKNNQIINVSVFMRLCVNHNENEDKNEK